MQINRIFLIILFLLSPSLCFGTVTITAQKRFVNHSYGEMVISGTCTRTDGVGYRILSNGSAITGHTGATLDADTTGNVFSGTITDIPVGDKDVDNGDYRIEVYHLEATEDLDTSDSFGCGLVVLRSGQSNQTFNGYNYFWSLISTPSGALWTYIEDFYFDIHGPLTHAPTQGEGDVSLGNILIENLDMPVLIVNVSYAASAISSWKTGTMIDDCMDAVEDITGERDAHFINWCQGESNYADSESTIEADLTTVIEAYEADSHADIIFIITEIGKYTDAGTDAQFSTLREAHKDVIGAMGNVYFGATTIHLALADGAHYPSTARTIPSQQVGLVYLYVSGESATNPAGWVADHFEPVSTTQTRIVGTHHAGTDFATITNGSNGIRVTDDGTSRTISTVARETANTLIITHDAVSGERGVDIGYGRSPVTTNWIKDNSELVSGGIPIETNTRLYEPESVSDSFTIGDSVSASMEMSVSASDGFTISDAGGDNWIIVSASDSFTIDDKARIKAGNINLKNVILKNVILKGN